MFVIDINNFMYKQPFFIYIDYFALFSLTGVSGVNSRKDRYVFVTDINNFALDNYSLGQGGMGR